MHEPTSDPRTGTGARAEGQTGQDDHPQSTSPIAFDLDSLTAAVASLNLQRIDDSCACQPRAAFVLLPGGWFQCGTTHDDGCPAVGGDR